MGKEIRGNLSYNQHHQTLKHTLDNEKVLQHHETSRLAIAISGVGGVAVVVCVAAYAITKACQQKHLVSSNNQKKDMEMSKKDMRGIEE